MNRLLFGNNWLLPSENFNEEKQWCDEGRQSHDRGVSFLSPLHQESLGYLRVCLVVPTKIMCQSIPNLTISPGDPQEFAHCFSQGVRFSPICHCPGVRVLNQRNVGQF